MATSNLVLRFVLELTGIAALGYAAFQVPDNAILRVLAGISASALLIGVWAIVVAPNASNNLDQPQRDLVGTVLLLMAAGALALAGEETLALAFGALVLLNTAFLFAFGHDARAAITGMGR